MHCVKALWFGFAHMQDATGSELENPLSRWERAGVRE